MGNPGRRTIKVIVEGVSDKLFWSKALPRHFPHQATFKVIKSGGRGTIVTDAVHFVEVAKVERYDRVIFILDRDADPCVSAVKEMFANEVRNDARVSIFVAVKGVECWCLADEAAIRALYSKPEYNAEPDTATVNPKKVLRDLAGRSLQKGELLTNWASQFHPDSVMQHSRSFAYFWTNLRRVISQSSN